MSTLPNTIHPEANLETVIEGALRAPNGPVLSDLMERLRAQGLHATGTAALRASCARLESQALTAPLHWLLHRLQNAGRPTHYADYLGLPLLIDDVERRASTGAGPAPHARSALVLIDELAGQLGELPELTAHPRRAELLKRVAAVQHACREAGFGPDRVLPPSPFVISVTLLPESGLHDELIFQRTLQMHELIFFAAGSLTNHATVAVAHNDAVAALHDLHWVARLTGLVMPLLGLLSPMTVESWTALRPYILQPSAIQSMGFHSLNVRLGELSRILCHPRYPEDQQPYLPLCEKLITKAIDLIQAWDRAHTSIAHKYSGHDRRDPNAPVTDGVRWLEQRHAPLTED